MFEGVAEAIRTQAPPRSLRDLTVDDGLLLDLLGLASTGGGRRRCEFVVVRDPDVRHQVARIYRQGWSIYKRLVRGRSDPGYMAARQWEADHFEDAPVLVVACILGRRPLFPAVDAASFYGSAFPAVQNLVLAAHAAGLGANVTTLALWSAWEARRTLGLPRRVTPVAVVSLGWPKGNAAPVPGPPVGNLVHLDRFGHQPFRARPLDSRGDMAL